MSIPIVNNEFLLKMYKIIIMFLYAYLNECVIFFLINKCLPILTFKFNIKLNQYINLMNTYFW